MDLNKIGIKAEIRISFTSFIKNGMFPQKMINFLNKARKNVKDLDIFINNAYR